jgi:hypothetical protein
MPIRASEKARYPNNWKAIVTAVRVRAGDRCECLGECAGANHPFEIGRCPNLQGKPSVWSGKPVMLTTAHLDHIPEHGSLDDLSNLKSFCNACHVNYDREHHAETRKVTRAVSS